MGGWDLIGKSEPEKGRYIFYISEDNSKFYTKGVFGEPDYDDVFVGKYMGNGYVDNEPDGEWQKVWVWFYAPDFSAIYPL